MKKNRSKYYNRLLKVMIFAVIVPTILLGGFFGVRFYRAAQDNLREASAAGLHQSVLRVDGQLKTLRTMMLQLVLDEDYQLLVNKEDNKDYELFNRVLKKMRTFASVQYLNMPVYNISIINCNYNWRLYSDRGMQPIDAEDARWYQKTAVEAEWCREPLYRINAQFQYVSTEDAFSLLMPGARNTVLVLQLSIPEFEQNLEPTIPESAMYVFDKTMQMVFREEENQAADSETTAPDMLNQITGPKGEFRLRQPGSRGYYFFETSEYNGWTYVMRLKDSSFTETLLSAILLMLAIMSAVGLVAGFIVRGLSKRLYQPVQNLYRHVTPVEPASSGRFDEIEVITKSVQKMLGENRSLNEELGKQHSMLKELVLYRLFSEQMDEEEAEDLCRQAQIDPAGGQMSVIGIVPFRKQSLESEEDYRDLYMLGINEVLTEETGERLVIAPVWIEDTAAVLLHTADLQEDYDASMRRLTETIYTATKEKLGLESRVGFSSRFEDVTKVSEAFTQVRRMLNDGVGEQKGLISRVVEKEGLRYPYYEEEVMLKAVSEDDLPAVQSALPVFVEKVERAHEDAYNREICYTLMLGNLMRLVPEYSATIIEQASVKLKGTDLLVHIVELPTEEKKAAWIGRYLIEPVMDTLHRKNDAHRQLLVNAMLNYIHNEYQGGMDIEVCATRLNYSAVYLRRVFKNSMGVSFKQYASRFIMDKAREMLAQTDTPVMEIAEALGFSNSQNFIRFFRKEEKVTPGQYRQERRGTAEAEEEEE